MRATRSRMRTMFNCKPVSDCHSVFGIAYTGNERQEESEFDNEGQKPVILVVNPKLLPEDEGDYQVSMERIRKGGKPIPVGKIFEKYGYTPRMDRETTSG